MILLYVLSMFLNRANWHYAASDTINHTNVYFRLCQ